MTDLPKPPKVPCGTCPYRRDVPSGLWAAEEYAKLPAYDGDTLGQLQKGAMTLFMCHQRDGCLCGGWLLTHDRHHLLALRLHPVDPSVWGYDPGTEVWGSGAQAAAHGMRDIESPSPEAHRKINGLLKQRGLTDAFGGSKPEPRRNQIGDQTDAETSRIAGRDERRQRRRDGDP